MPDKKKYNFMGVSSINKQGTPQQHPQQNSVQENEYGTVQPNSDPTPSSMFRGQNSSEFPAMTTTLSANSSKKGSHSYASKNPSQIKSALQPSQLPTGPMSINNMFSGANSNVSADLAGAPATLAPGAQRLRADAAFSPLRKGGDSFGPHAAINPSQLTLPQAKQLP